MSDIFERILYLVEKEANGKAQKFGEMIGFSGQAVRYVSNLRRNNPNFKMLVAILETFVWVNPDWLILGRDPMKRSEDEISSISPELLLKRIEELAIENNELKREVVRLGCNKKNSDVPVVGKHGL